ncbi:CvpA family protein [Roseospira visakhapatnamensis]|uniref:Membrane protein required for colicin V production n=1 Tax=Roseospira visakhapatnamensis TaxID=390880 RepID=A0A7W6RGN2_9PROT|nr:CvpA family protein [Roseospira visakhapatnamensis]MBB4267689.1 membrane protein required for colicin V production [Roseospira visakhapatnamensis]
MSMDSWPINPVDMGVLLILLISAILAFFRGFVHEVMGIGAWIGAILVAVYGLPLVQPYVRPYIPIEWAADLTAAVALFLVALVVFSIITTLIARRVQDSALNSLDRSLGFLFGLARGALVVIVIYVSASWLVPPETQPRWVREARSMPMIRDGQEALYAMLPPALLAEQERLRRQAGEAAAGVNNALDAQRAFEDLRQPRPQAPPRPGVEGYQRDERQEMNRLIESTQ